MSRLHLSDMDKLRVALAVVPFVPASVESAEDAVEYLKKIFPLRPVQDRQGTEEVAIRQRVKELEHEVRALKEGLDTRDVGTLSSCSRTTLSATRAAENIRLKQEIVTLKAAGEEEEGGKGKKKKRKNGGGGTQEERERRLGRLEGLFTAGSKDNGAPQPAVLSALRDVHTLLSSPSASSELAERTLARAIHSISSLFSALLESHTSPSSSRPDWLPPARKHPELLRALEGILCGLFGDASRDLRRWAEGMVYDGVLRLSVEGLRVLSTEFLKACLVGRQEVDIRAPIVELVQGVMRGRKKLSERIGLACLAELEELCRVEPKDRQALLAAKDGIPHLLSVLRSAVLNLSGEEGQCDFGRVVLERLGRVHGEIVAGTWAGRRMGRVVEDAVLGVVELAWMRSAEAEMVEAEAT